MKSGFVSEENNRIVREVEHDLCEDEELLECFTEDGRRLFWVLRGVRKELTGLAFVLNTEENGGVEAHTPTSVSATG